MSSIYDALQRGQNQKDLLSLKGAGGDSLRRSTILWLILLTVIISSLSTMGIFYGIRMLKDDNGIVKDVSMPKESLEPLKTASHMKRDNDMHGAVDSIGEDKKYVEAVDLKPDNAEDYLKLGGRYYESGEYDKALLTYTKALAYYRDDARILNNIGSVMLAKGKREKAIGYFVQANMVSEDFVEPVYNMSCAYALMGDRAKALSSLKKAFALNPQVVKWAAQDPDLSNLKGVAEFDAMIHEQ